MTGGFGDIFYMLTSVQLNLIMVCFLSSVWYNQLIILPCFKGESAMPTVMKITKGVQVLTRLKAQFVDIYFNLFPSIVLPCFKVKA